MKQITMYLLIMLSASISLAQLTAPNLEKDKTLYVVGYAHLDTQWRWDYQTTIDEYIKNTLDDNFALLEKYPDYVFNFTGARRYAMMKEYYPEKYERVKKYIQEGRWFVSGSSVDECDVLVPSPESILRQILYGNQYFCEEFDVESKDFMLPDCFGFPAYLPTLWSHAGLLGFSTQKLSWGSVVGVPFNVGVWEGPDGKSIIGAMNPSAYVSSLDERPDLSQHWIDRVNDNGDRSGVYADYRYYGTGDTGGAPRESDVKLAAASVRNNDGKINIVLGSSAQLYEDITPQQKTQLPKYSGELMLTEHSSGVLTSQAYMKRWNRKNEQLADAAERAAVISNWLGATKYPAERLHNSWWRFLANQMHDILPGTTLPKGYEYAWNDEILASNGFAAVLMNSIGGISRGLDTRVKGQPVVVYNPLSIQREDIVTATVALPGTTSSVRVYDDRGKEVPSQILSNDTDGIKVIFLANVSTVSVSVYDIRPSSRPCSMSSGLRIKGQAIENDFYRVEINQAGDIASIYDKKAGREMLSKPARLEFNRANPHDYPAWNMDWTDRMFGPTGYVDGPAEISVVENGPVRIALEVKRRARNSIFVQKICLMTGDCGKRIEVHNNVDWQSSACVLKASFPLTVSNQVATYTQGLGTIQRSNNNPKQYEMLSHEWFDLTGVDADYGVSILEDCKFGSDKPADNVVRLTLLHTPGTRDVNYYMDQRTQDWGRHEFIYALYGHPGSWRQGLSEFQGRRLNQPLKAFQVDHHKGTLGRSFSMLKLNTQQVDVRAIKKAEEGDRVVIRLQELLGKNAPGVVLSLGRGITSGYEVDGQGRKIAEASIKNGTLHLDMSKNAIRSFALKLADPTSSFAKPVSEPVVLDYNVQAFSHDHESVEGVFGSEERSMPAEMIPESLECDNIMFKMGDTQAGQNDAMVCRGQTINLPKGDYNRVYILAAADEDTDSKIQIGKDAHNFSVQCWTGYIGQYDRRIWDRPFKKVDFNCTGLLTDIEKGYIKRDNVAWFCTHRHNKDGGNEAYQFSYVFKYGYDLGKDIAAITLPNNPAIKIFAVSVANDLNRSQLVCDLYDNFDDRQDIVLRQKQGGLTKGKQSSGSVMMEKANSYDGLKIKPSTSDYADQAAGNEVEFLYVSYGPYVAPHTGGWDGKLPRLNNGVVGQNEDDVEHSTFFDNGQGRFVADLEKPIEIAQVNTYSWHKSDRAPQKFSLWAAAGSVLPDADLSATDGSGWTLIANVDTHSLGEGGVHLSSVSFPPDRRFQYLMWVTDVERQGTFFNEIDVKARQ